jgi:hypothetical protein
MEPLPCPFCGSDEIEVEPYDSSVLCHDCGAWMPNRTSTIPQVSHGALEMWNTRKGVEQMAKKQKKVKPKKQMGPVVTGGKKGKKKK